MNNHEIKYFIYYKYTNIIYISIREGLTDVFGIGYLLLIRQSIVDGRVVNAALQPLPVDLDWTDDTRRRWGTIWAMSGGITGVTQVYC